MKKSVAFFLVVALMLSCVGCGTVDTNESSLSSSENTNSEISSENTTNDNLTVSETVYAEDKVVNRFISEFNASSDFQMEKISKGNIRTKFFAEANGCYIEMINANDAAAEYFVIKIDGGNETVERDKMFAVATDAIKVFDPSIDDSKIAQVIKELEGEQDMIEDYKITESVIVRTYIPIAASKYHRECHIEIISNDYK